MEKTVRLLMALLRCDILGEAIDGACFKSLSEDEWKKIYTLAKHHDLAHLVADAVVKQNLMPESASCSAFEKQVFTAVFRYEKLNREYDEIKKLFENEKIRFIPLKGSVIRRFYPEPWMRTSCDIDILIHKEDLEKAKSALVRTFSYTCGEEYYHDVALTSPSGVHLELHFNLTESSDFMNIVLEKCWEYAFPIESDGFEYGFTNEFFLFHQYAHAAHHFMSGGCGLRPLLDLFLLRDKLEFNKDTLNTLLEQAKIKTFVERFDHLADIYFADSSYDDVTKAMENYLITGGVYGSGKNLVGVNRFDNGGLLKTLWNRIWLPYDVLKYVFPKLQGKKYLLFFYEIRRWFLILKTKRLKNGVNELKINISIDDAEIKDISQLMNSVGLKQQTD